MSQSDVEAGERWASEVGKELQASNYGIICITRENISSPWILFEAGALAKSIEESRVIPLLLDLEFKEISGPLAQFQAKKVEKSHLAEIVSSVNKLDSQSLPESRLNELFDSLWPRFEQLIKEIPGPSEQIKKNRPQQEILEELVSGVRGLEIRFRESLDDMPRWRRHRARFHPRMLDEISHNLKLRRGDPLRMLFFASFLRDDLPWLYELAVEVYRAGPSGSPKTKRAQQKFHAAVHTVLRNGMLLEYSRDKEAHMLVREMEHILLEDLSFLEEQVDDEPETAGSKDAVR